MQDNLRQEKEKKFLSDLLCYFSSEHSMLAERLIEEFFSLENILGKQPYILKETQGITNSIAEFLYYLPQFFCAASEVFEGLAPLTSPENCVPLLQRLFRFRIQEEVFLIFLNKKFKPVDCIKCGNGEIDTAEISINRIKDALRKSKNTPYLLLAHNHPSGTALPSKEDSSVVQLIAKQADLNNIMLLDSLIYTKKECYSFFLGSIVKFGEKTYKELLQ